MHELGAVIGSDIKPTAFAAVVMASFGPVVMVTFSSVVMASFGYVVMFTFHSLKDFILITSVELHFIPHMKSIDTR